MTSESPAPRATYRLQLTPSFTFDDAANQMPYLDRLGISHAYLSPITEAVPGSLHGYDVTDPGRLRAELGGEEGFARLVAAARRNGVGLLVDAVPNHMAADPVANPWWRDVLEDGEQSPYAEWFDVEWHGPDPELSGRVLVPILAESLDATLASRGAVLALDRGRLVLRVPGTALPLGLQSVATVIGAASVRSENEALAEIGAETMLLLPGTTPESRRLRFGARARIHDRLEHVCATDPSAVEAIEERLAALARDARRLRALIDVQAWVLDGWRQGTRRLNYRRFFTISSLVAMRADAAEAREPGIGRVLELARDGTIDGIRVDHIDGMRDPGGWLGWLRAASHRRWTLVEKVLAAGERVPEAWPADGTTGYEFAALLVRLSLDPHGASVLEVLRDDVAGPRPEFAQIVREAKLALLDGALAPDWDRVARRLEAVAEHDPALAEHPPTVRSAALRDLVIALRAYRTYVRDDGTASPADRAEIAGAVSRAAVNSAVPRALIDLLASRLLGEGWDDAGRCAALVAGVQQLSPALAAKAVEDTALYRDVALLARNEVGCEPDLDPIGVAEFHAWCLEAQRERPRSLLATSTHDTKRSEDVRARLCVLSEVAGWWAHLVKVWCERHADLDPSGDAMLVLLQSLLGAWPIDADRALVYLLKAMREAGERTSWIDPVAEYESRLGALVQGLLGDPGFVSEMQAAVERVRPLAERASLAWTLLRLTAPGVPDTYQGCELWDLSLVDPDNRRPVDFDLRAQLLDAVVSASAGELLNGRAEGLPKLAVIRRALDLRRRRPELFGDVGDYLPLRVDGELADHCIAFARGAPPGAVSVAPRLPAAVAGGWRGTRVQLPPGRWRDLFGWRERHGGAAVDLDDLLGAFPVALLERVS